MGTNNTYQIPFIGLKDGVHLQEFEITDSFFESFESSSIQKCDLAAKVSLLKVDQNNMTLSFSFEGWINMACNRCMVSLKETIHDSYQVQVKLTDDENLLNTDEVDMLYLNATTSILELDQLFYEYIHLSIPITSTCDNKEFDNMPCDPQILKYLNEKEENTNVADPRWAALEKLKK